MSPPKRGEAFDGSTACPLCGAEVRGIDPQRTCAACQAKGAAARLPWEQIAGDDRESDEKLRAALERFARGDKPKTTTNTPKGSKP